MNNYRTLTKFEITEIKKYLKDEKDIYSLQYFLEEILREHYTEGWSDKEREVVENFNNLINSKFVEKGTIL